MSSEITLFGTNLKYPLYLVIWRDAIQHDDGSWFALREIKSELPIIVSVGGLVDETAESITLVSTWEHCDDPDGSGILTIPKAGIKRVEPLSPSSLLRGDQLKGLYETQRQSIGEPT